MINITNKKCTWEYLITKYIKPLINEIYHFTVENDTLLKICRILLVENTKLIAATKDHIRIKKNNYNLDTDMKETEFTNDYTDIYNTDCNFLDKDIEIIQEQTQLLQLFTSQPSQNNNQSINTIHSNYEEILDSECRCKCHNKKETDDYSHCSNCDPSQNRLNQIIANNQSEDTMNIDL